MSFLKRRGRDSKEVKRAIGGMFTESYNNVTSRQNGSVDPDGYFHLDIGSRERWIYRTSYNRNGKLVKLPVSISTKYLKFSLGLNIMSATDKKNKRKRTHINTYQSLVERSKMNTTSLDIYVDGVKIPDNICYITVMDGSTDIYVPHKYVLTENSQLDVIVRTYNDKNKYKQYYRIIEDNDGIFSQSEFDMDFALGKDNLRIYLSGLLLQRSQYELLEADGVADRYVINFKNIEKTNPNPSLEVKHEFDTVYYREVESITNPVIEFRNDDPELEFIKNLPVSPGICDIYLGGRRLFSKDISVASPRYFVINDARYAEGLLDRMTIFMNYNGKSMVVDEYNEDTFKFFNSVESELAKTIIKDKLIPEYGLGWLHTNKFPRRDIYSPSLHLQDNSADIDTVVKDYLSENAYNLLPLLSEFSYAPEGDQFVKNEYIADHIRYNTAPDIGSITTQINIPTSGGIVPISHSSSTFNNASFEEAHVVFIRPAHYPELAGEDVLVYIDNIKILKKYVYTVSMSNKIYIYVNRSQIPNKDFIINITHVPVYNHAKKAIKFIPTEETRDNYTFNLSDLGSVHNINNILLFEVAEYNEGNPDKVEEDTNPMGGWRLLSQFNIVDNGDGTATLTGYAGTINRYHLLFNGSFYKYYEFEVTDGDNFIDPEDIGKNMIEPEFINTEIYDFSTEHHCYLPHTSIFKHLLFVNGKPYLENIDYLISNQLTHPSLNNSKIIFKNRPKKNDIVELYFIEEPRFTFSDCKFLDIPGYDVIYIKNSDIGFSKRYMDLYINDIVVPQDRIIEVAMNMLLIRKLPEMFGTEYTRPYVRSRLRRNLTGIYHYINHFNNNQSDFKIYLDRLVFDSDYERIKEIIDSCADSECGRHNTAEDVEGAETISPLLDLIARHLIESKISRRIDANRDIEYINQPQYVEVMTVEEASRPYVKIDSNDNNITRDVEISPDATLRPLYDIVRLVFEAIKNRLLPLFMDANVEMTEEEFDKTSLGKEIYIEELELGISNNDIGVADDYIVDANDAIGNEDGVLVKEQRELTMNKFKRRFVDVVDDNGNIIGTNFISVANLNNMGLERITHVYINDIAVSFTFENGLLVLDQLLDGTAKSITIALERMEYNITD